MSLQAMSHHSAKASHYNEGAKNYDAFNEKNSLLINRVIEEIFQKYKVQTVLDLTCGTGSQVFWLAKKGYKIVGYDINSNMLKIARSKAKQKGLNLSFYKGDMRTIKAGKFDAVITIFNAIGHLTKLDFEKTIKNIYKNLNDGGLYLFDICNLSYLMKDNNITNLTIDWQKIIGENKIREIQYSMIDKDGILASYTISYEQENTNELKIISSMQTLQVYTAKQLRELLLKNRFQVLHQCGIDGSRFLETKTDRILTIAKKQSAQIPTIPNP